MEYFEARILPMNEIANSLRELFTLQSIQLGVDVVPWKHYGDQSEHHHGHDHLEAVRLGWKRTLLPSIVSREGCSKLLCRVTLQTINWV